MNKIIRIPNSFVIDNIPIYSIIPVHNESCIVIISKNIKRNQYLSIKINNTWYGCKIYKNKDSPRGDELIYKCNVYANILNMIKNEGAINAELFSHYKRITITTKIIDFKIDYPLKFRLSLPYQKKLCIVESHNHIFFPINDIDNPNSKNKTFSIIKAVIVWIEYHLQKGVDQIFINQSKQLNENCDDSTNFWFELLAPYVESGQVVLVIYEDKFGKYEYQHIIQTISLWLNKGRSKWFATHDFDEFICPLNGTWINDNKQTNTTKSNNIPKMLSKIPNYINYVKTKMIRTAIADTSGVYIKKTLIDKTFMTSWHKCIVKTDDVYVLWTHIPSHWAKPRNANNVHNILRINHYKPDSTSTSHSNYPSIPYDGLQNERESVLCALNKIYGEDFDNIIFNIANKYMFQVSII
jgi:hypothetical protein